MLNMTKQIDNTNFVNLIKQSIKEKNISLRALCKKAEIDASYLSKVMLGKRNAPDCEETLNKIAAALEIRPEKVFLSVGRVPKDWQLLYRDEEFFNMVNLRLANIKTAVNFQISEEPQIKIPDELL